MPVFCERAFLLLNVVDSLLCSVDEIKNGRIWGKKWSLLWYQVHAVKLFALIDFREQKIMKLLEGIAMESSLL